jgi:hypothetical protein
MAAWRERVSAAALRGCFTADDAREAKDWATCAVGEQRAAMPGVFVVDLFTDSPYDETLFHLGRAFYWNVSNNDVNRASDLLDQIEDRVLELKRGEEG